MVRAPPKTKRPAPGATGCGPGNSDRLASAIGDADNTEDRAAQRARIVLPDNSLLTPELATEWIVQVGRAWGGRPALSAASMRRLRSAATKIVMPLVCSLAPDTTIVDGRIRLFRPHPFAEALDVTFDPRTYRWEDDNAIGWGIEGLAGRVWRPQTHRRNLDPLDGATGLAACLGLAYLAVRERDKRR